MRIRLGCLIAVCALTGCVAAGPAGSMSWDASPEGGAGTLTGQVRAWREGGFQTIAGIPVQVPGGPSAISDSEGHFVLRGLAPGPVAIVVEATGYQVVAPACRLPADAGLEGVPIALLPESQPSGEVLIAGILTDEHGVGVPKGTVHGVDATSEAGAGGNHRWTTNGEGFFSARLSQVKAGGMASFSGYGFGRNRLPVEVRILHTLALPAQGVLPLALMAETVKR